MYKGKNLAYLGGSKRFHATAGWWGWGGGEESRKICSGFLLLQAWSHGGLLNRARVWPQAYLEGNAGRSKGDCVTDLPESWIMTPSDFLHCLLFQKFMGHLVTRRHIVHLLSCVWVCPLCSDHKTPWVENCVFFPSETWAEFNSVCQHSLAIRHLQYTHEKESDFLELSRGYLWGSSRAVMWQVKSQEAKLKSSGPPKHGCGEGEWSPKGRGMEVVLDLKLSYWRLKVWESSSSVSNPPWIKVWNTWIYKWLFCLPKGSIK